MTHIYWAGVTLALVLGLVLLGYVAYESRATTARMKAQLEVLEAERKDLYARREKLNKELQALRNREKERLDQLSKLPVTPEENVVSDVLKDAMQGAKR